jgi:hypothetical protein
VRIRRRSGALVRPNNLARTMCLGEDGGVIRPGWCHAVEGGNKRGGAWWLLCRAEGKQGRARGGQLDA